ncbi:MAG: glycine oxidase ThiO [Acidobacteriota bacterium]
MRSDVLIIGAGVIGLSIARELRKRGAGNITVLEKGRAGREASWAAAGMLAPQAETDAIDNFYELCSESRDLYPEFADQLLEETGVNIELDRSGTLYLAFTDEDVEAIEGRFTWQRCAGLSVESLSATECRVLEPGIWESVKGGLLFANDWQVENRKLVEALIEFSRISELEIIENTTVTDLAIDGNKISGARTSDGQFFAAGAVVLATGAWTSLIKIGELALPVHVKPIRGQMICFQQSERRFQRVIYSPRAYIVPRTDGRLLVGATVEDVGFDTSNTMEGIDALKANAVEIAPSLADRRVSQEWAGLRPFAMDGLPLIGRFPNVGNLFLATAHYRNGILLAPLTAKLVAESIVSGRDNSLLEPFGPQRFLGRTINVI